MKATTILNLAALAFAYGVAQPANAALGYPYGLAVDPTNKTLYIADADGSGRVVKYDPVKNTLGTFVAVDTPFSVAVNNDGVVYVGVVGQNTRLAAYDAQAKLLGTFPVPPGASPLNLAIDANNDVFMTPGLAGDDPVPASIFLYTSDLSIDYQHVRRAPYVRLSAGDAIDPGTRYSLISAKGRMYIVGVSGSAGFQNVADLSSLLTGQVQQVENGLLPEIGPGPNIADAVNRFNQYRSAHHAETRPSFASTTDSDQNILSTDPEGRTINAASLKYPSKVLLGNLSSAPYGIAHDASRNRLYVAFPSEHRVRVYQINYTSQGGVNVPASLTHKATLY